VEQIDFFVTEKPAVTWQGSFTREREEPYFKDLTKIIEKERLAGRQSIPKNSDVFNALQFCPFESVKVVDHRASQSIMHGPNQAHGLCSRCFQVPAIHHL